MAHRATTGCAWCRPDLEYPVTHADELGYMRFTRCEECVAFLRSSFQFLPSNTRPTVTSRQLTCIVSGPLFEVEEAEIKHGYCHDDVQWSQDSSRELLARLTR